ncbi:hypothetical protein D3C85_1563170 [compost metagenome]
MEMGVERVCDGCVFLLGKTFKNIRHPNRIYDRGFSVRNDHVGKAAFAYTNELVELSAVV